MQVLLYHVLGQPVPSSALKIRQASGGAALCCAKGDAVLISAAGTREAQLSLQPGCATDSHLPTVGALATCGASLAAACCTSSSLLQHTLMPWFAVPLAPLQTVQTLLEGRTGKLKITKKFNHRLHETVVRLYTTSGGTAKASSGRTACGGAKVVGDGCCPACTAVWFLHGRCQCMSSLPT